MQTKEDDRLEEISPLASYVPSDIDVKKSHVAAWTDSLRAKTTHEPNIVPAAYLIRDAVIRTADDTFGGHGFGMIGSSFVDAQPYNPHDESNGLIRNAISLLCRKVLAWEPFRFIVFISALGLVLLSFVEPPSWCLGTIEGCDILLNAKGPPAFTVSGTEESVEEVEYYPNFGITLLNTRQSLYTESVFLFFLVLFVLFQIGKDGSSLMRYLMLHSQTSGEDSGSSGIRRLFGNEIFGIRFYRRALRFVQLGSIICLILGLVEAIFYGRKRDFVPLIRIATFLTFSRGAQRELETFVRLMPDLFSALFLLLCIVIFYAWMGVVAFHETHEGTESFSDIFEAMWTLWICITTANYPDVMMPAYNQSRLVVFYFVSFMAVSFFFMMNVILASVVNSYNIQMCKRTTRLQAKSEDNLKEAFRQLDSNGIGGIDKKTMMALFLVLNEDCDDVRRIPQEKAELLFAILDKDGSSQIEEDEFMSFCDVLLLEFEEASAYKTMIESCCPKMYTSSWFKNFRNAVKSDRFELVIDFILLLNAVVIAAQSYPELAGKTVSEDPKIADGEVDTPWEVMETIFTIIYCMEMFTKVMVLGLKRYSQSYRNLFDGMITILSVLATWYVYYPNEFSDSRLIRYVVMARVLRLTRVIVAMPQFQVIGKTFLDIVPAAARIVLLLFIIMYSFSVVGMRLFGGMITRDPANDLSYRLDGTDFADNAYWANNFNDMLSGMNVMFNLLVVNNWPEQADGILAVTGSKYTRLFFLAFHILGVIVVNNLVLAVIIDSFMSEWALDHRIRSTEVDTGDAIIADESHAFFEASNVTGTKTNLSGDYVATFGGLGRKRGNLQHFFTINDRSSSTRIDA
uniref:EF-hand domain-containing protein n=2 Tax=Ditylum brightwellii TaxID=49249 RepID=A0A7S4S586_9STRA|mmetsp:Transcript_60335/g.89502  ORF Transcript_60335/g.89502 Transcript_60335/m.89502 type:complete len:854 (-) Transcript_60335:91-2652(-)